MSNDQTPQSQKAKTEELTFEIPDIMGLVGRYFYVNHTRVGSTAADVRIAFTDLNPLAKAEERVGQPIGVVMSHKHARSLLTVLQGIVQSLDEDRSESKEPELVIKRPD